MGFNFNNSKHLFLSRNLVITIVLFLIVASGLVVLTNTAINLITVSRDYTALMANWDQANYARFQRLKKYTSSGLDNDYQKYIKSQNKEFKIRSLISNLFEGKSEITDVYSRLSGVGMNKDDISKLIINFHYYQNLYNSGELRKSWKQLENKSAGTKQLASSAKQLYVSGQNTASQKASLLHRIEGYEKNITGLTQNVFINIGIISTWISRMALWLTVILGILMVLAGVVFSVKGWKSINKWEQTVDERDFLASFPELNPNPVLQINNDGSLGYINPATQKIFSDINEKGLKHAFLKNISDYFKKENVNKNRKEQYLVQTNGKYYLQHLKYSPNGIGLRINAQEITERIEKQEQLRQSLKEKGVLLSEIHHRVKNNLAVISGLLEIQSMHINNPVAALKNSQERIKSMAAIHEILYKTDSFSEIPFKNYLKKLIEQICNAYLNSQEYISVHTEITDTKININQAVPCGLILNELLSNAMKHAYEKDQQGQINVRFIEKGEHINLSVQDYGKGLPKEFSLHDTQTTGFTIVHALVKQLKADITVNNQNGTAFNILFQKSARPGSSNAKL